jgi:hypothetical protein
VLRLYTLVSLLAASTVQAAAPGVAVIDLEGLRGVDKGSVRLLNESLLTELRDSGAFASVIGGSDLGAMLDMEQQKQVLGCGDDGCLAEIGGALGVPLMVTGGIGRLGETVFLHLKLLNVDDAEVVGRVQVSIPCESALVAGMRQAVQQLVATIAPEQSITAANLTALCGGGLRRPLGQSMMVGGGLILVYSFLQGALSQGRLTAESGDDALIAYGLRTAHADRAALFGWSSAAIGLAFWMVSR